LVSYHRYGKIETAKNEKAYKIKETEYGRDRISGSLKAWKKRI
jgi:hypothetical protein